MIKKSLIVISTFFLFGFSANSMADKTNTLKSAGGALHAAYGSTQYVPIMNALANPAAPDLTKSDVTVKFYDGSGNKPPCWIEYRMSYHNDPLIAGAGGYNACGAAGTSPAAIVRIDILPLKAAAGKVYDDLIGVSIDPSKFYNNIIIEQETAPEFYSDGSLKTPGTIRIESLTE